MATAATLPSSHKIGGGPCGTAARKEVWPEGTEFITAPLLCAQRVGQDTLYVQWYDNSEKGKSKLDRDESLVAATGVMNSVPRGVKLRLIVDASEMSLWFVTTNLKEWVEALCQTAGWMQIDTCLVVVNSMVVRLILEMFPMEKRVTFVETLEEACGQLKLDPDLFMT